MISVEDYEKLGSFYLGKKYDLNNRQLLDEVVNYDSRDLVTHALCVGMTGSGKTGLCLSLLEEAAIDEVPIICVDPKGDLGNLLLTFPELNPSDFQPWIDPSEVSRLGKPIENIAEDIASRWRKGLTDWHQPIDRIQKLKDAANITIYTPGSNIGVPLTVLKSFDAPPPEALEDAESYREKVSSSASALLALMGVEADPLTSREHILISNILDASWKKGVSLSLEDLIRQIQSPPISKVGVIDLESFYPVADRTKLSMSLNNLLASPAFAGWLQGQPLNIKELLYTKEGKPRVSILSIAHLNDSERMFFVTILLGELLSWMRAQPGTGSLRAIFYMDEVYGYFPPSAKPPSKPPMLTLLKQARAFGLGIVLATQNPMDLDYKGLANMGTWFLGRLQTQRDKDRVLDGLEGASLQQGAPFQRAEMEKSLSALGNRVFLMNNVHDDGPTLFQTRWALSFLRGPLSREQITALMREKRNAKSPANSSGIPATDTPAQPATTVASSRPVIPATITERFLEATRIPGAKSRIVYRPALLADTSVHFVRATSSIDHWEDSQWILSADSSTLQSDLWEGAETVEPGSLQLRNQPEDMFSFSDIPAEMLSAKNFASWEKELKEYLFRHRQCTLYYSKALKLTSQPGVQEVDARIDLAHKAKEARDREIEKLRDKLADKLRSLQTKISAAQQRLDRQKEEAQSRKLEGLVNVGTSILGAFFGRKLASKTNMSKAASAVKSIGKATSRQGDVMRAEETLESLIVERDDLERDAKESIEAVQSKYSPESLELEAIEIPIRKSDTKVKSLIIAWVPWQVDANGIASPLVEWKAS